LCSEALAKPLWGVCKREVRIQNTEVRIIGHVAHERVTILNTEYGLLNTALAEPTKEVLQAPLLAGGQSVFTQLVKQAVVVFGFVTGC